MIILFLDLDGVLITTASWKADEIDSDGYSKFSPKLVMNLNKLLHTENFEIWLSSSRRLNKSLEELNEIFKTRNISKSIKGLLPYFPPLKNRKEEIERFVKENKIEDYLILDDDKSLNGLPIPMKEKLVLTQYMKGFNEEKLSEALNKIKTKT